MSLWWRAMTSPVRAARGQISPELVLIDPELRRFLAEADPLEPPRWAVQPRPSPTLATKAEAAAATVQQVAAEPVVVERPQAPAAVERAQALVLPFERPVPAVATTARRPPRRATLAVALVAGALTLGAGGAAAPSQRAEPSFPDASGTEPAIVSAGQPVERSFVWTPVSGAAAYRVEFFLGDERVFATRTPTAQLTLPAVWRDDDGRLRALTPGSYRWYVWPLGADGRAVGSGKAIVQARLEVDE
jgi:hypothetical protein